MKLLNRFYLLLICLMLSFGFFGTFHYIIKSHQEGLILAIVCVAVGAIFLNHWHSISYVWICQTCHSNRQLNLIENMIHQGTSSTKKVMHCKACQSKSSFKSAQK